MLIGVRIEGVEALAGWIVGYDGGGSTLDEELAQTVAVVGGIGGTKTARGQRSKERERGAHVTELTGRYLEGDEPAFAIDDGVDFGRATAA